MSAPAKAHLGATISIGIDLRGTSAALHIVHIDTINPNGQRVLHYSQNLIAKNGHAVKLLPLASNDAAGIWTLRIHDLLSGQQKQIEISVE